MDSFDSGTLPLRVLHRKKPRHERKRRVKGCVGCWLMQRYVVAVVFVFRFENRSDLSFLTWDAKTTGLRKTYLAEPTLEDGALGGVYRGSVSWGRAL